MLLKIVWKNLAAKKLTSFLCIVLMLFGICIISLVVTIGKQLEDKFSKNISGIDMVVGAKGSPLQLILSGVYQIDAPTGNILLTEANMISKNPLVKEFIPISMGDNFKGFRIVGTNKKYIDHFKASFSDGQLFDGVKQVVLGSSVSNQLGLKIGDSFSSAHGFKEEGEVHEDEKLIVTGILKFNNSVIDNLILTSLETVWDVHEHGKINKQSQIEPDVLNKEITCALVKFRSPMGLMTIPRNINSNTNMQAALPAIEINRLFELMGIGINAINLLALAIILISGISVFVTLYNSLKERKYEMALMLSMGAKRTKLFGMLLLEGLFLSLIGYILGILLSRIGLYIASNALESNMNYTLNQMVLQKEEIILLIGALLVGIFAAAIPSLGVYKINISKTLAND
jgi:putative ABC transport system permease protein